MTIDFVLFKRNVFYLFSECPELKEESMNACYRKLQVPYKRSGY